jgi:stress-induced morphogen
MVTVDQLVAKIQEGLPGAEIRAQDLTGGGDHWQVNIQAPQFKGLSLVEQHQLVYRALGDWMKEKIHALSMNTSELQS